MFKGKEQFEFDVNIEIEFLRDTDVGDLRDRYGTFFFLMSNNIKVNPLDETYGNLYYYLSVCRGDYDFDSIPQGLQKDFWNTPRSAYDHSVSEEGKSPEILMQFKNEYGDSVLKGIVKYLSEEKSDIFNGIVTDLMNSEAVADNFKGLMFKIGFDVDSLTFFEEGVAIDESGNDSHAAGIEMTVHGETQEVGVGHEVNVPSSRAGSARAQRLSGPMQSVQNPRADNVFVDEKQFVKFK